MFLTKVTRSGLAAGLFFVLIPLVWADDYTRTANGSFSSTDWYDHTNNMPPPQGPPGGGDTAALNDWDVTASGGSVMTLGGGGLLTVTGIFTATTASGFTLKGLGTCNATTSTFIDVDGGHLSTGNDAGKNITVLGGGSETATTIAAGTQGVVSSNGSLVVKSQATDLNLTLQTGGTAEITDIQNGMDVSVSVDGTGSALTVDQDFDVTGGFLDLTGGGALIASEDLVLDGVGNVGGGGHWSGPMTKITLGGTVFVGNIAPAPGFALGIDSGTVVDSGNAIIASEAGSVGNVTLDGTGTLWEVQTTGMGIGQSGSGTLNMTGGAHLQIDSGAVLGVGVNGGSKGTLTADGAGTLIDASKSAGVSIGKLAGTSGSAALTNGASFMGGVAFKVGDTGTGALTARSGSKITETAAVDLIVGSSAGSSGDLEVQDAGSSLTVPQALVVGEDGNGAFSVGFGGVVNFAANQNKHLVIANGDGSTGEVQVLGTSFVDNGPELIGGFGKATFNAGYGASLTTAFVTAPAAEGGQATITVDSSAWVNTVNFYLGGLTATDPVSTLILQNNATMRVSDRMTIFPAGSVTIDGTSMMAVGPGAFGPAGSVRVSTGGILSGAGKITGKVIEAGGEIFPGNSPGVLTIDGDYEQDAGSTYSAEIGGTTAGSGFDQIKVTGAATLGGTLQVQLVKGFTPTVGQTFQLLSAASKSGSFATISPPSQAGIALTTDATGVT
ncbi:MAG: beta strand repeat-containing protein, partial [Terriglobia bacterium]